jgi:hypothetical protein
VHAVDPFGSAPSAVGASPVQPAAFTVASNGTTTILLGKKASSADTLAEALAYAGAPAVITVGSFCQSDAKPSGIGEVLSVHSPRDGLAVVTVTPSAMPEARS